MTQLVAGMNQDGDETVQEVNTEGVREVTRVLHQNIQDAFRTHFQKQLDTEGESEDADGNKKEVKVQVHVLKMDEAGQIDPSNAGIAQMLQSMLGEGGQQQTATIDLTTEAENVDLAAAMDGETAQTAGIDASNIAEALKAMLGQTTGVQMATGSEEEESGDDE